MRTSAILSMLLALLILVGCSTSSAPAWDPDKVIADVLSHQYRFGGPERKTAIEDIEERDGQRSVPMLKQIATMTRTLAPDRELADLLAIQAALVALVDLRDPDATELNRRRFQDDSMRGLVIINLKRLKAWEATPDIESWLATAPVQDYRMHVMTLAADFLASSPRSTSASCVASRRLRTAFVECGGESPTYRCIDLTNALNQLDRHLQCSGSSNPH